MLTDIEGVKIGAQGHEHAAVLRVFLGDHKAQHVAVEPLRGLLVGYPEIDVADSLQLDHEPLPRPCADNGGEAKPPAPRCKHAPPPSLPSTARRGGKGGEAGRHGMAGMARSGKRFAIWRLL
jgi:hypothetical protein